VFDKQKLTELFEKLDIPRIKGILHTEQGWFSFNKMRKTLTTKEYKGDSNLLEMIALSDTEKWQEVSKKIKSIMIE